MKFRTFFVSLLLTVSSVTFSLAQSGSKSVFEFPLDTSVTYQNIIDKFGEPDDISGNEGEPRMLYYNVSKPNAYMYGWVILLVNARDKFSGYHLKVKEQYTTTKITLDEFKSKFQLPEELVNLFYMNEKNLKAYLTGKGYTLEKAESGLDYLNAYTVKGVPPLFGNVEIQLGKGNSFEKSKNDDFTRQGKIYNLEVSYINRFVN